jgi:hypothetical protein
MRAWKVWVPLFLLCSVASGFESRLPFGTVFKGQDQFNRLVAKAKAGNWGALPIGERTAAVGQALVGTRYKHFTLEIDNRIESPSVNFQGMECWTFFEISLAFARMLNDPEPNWTPERLLHYIELDRYRGGQCTGEYLSRLHYLEDWLYDNDRRGLVEDMTRKLGGRSVPHSAREMTVGWRHYRYLASNQRVRSPELNRSCAAETSSELLRANEVDAVQLRTLALLCAQATACCTSCMLPRRVTTVALSWIHSFRNTFIVTAPTAGFSSPGHYAKTREERTGEPLLLASYSSSFL